MTKISRNNSSELNDAVHKRTDVDREVTARSIFGLALPALGVLAAMPLYLLLDTAVVGRLGSFELAALGAGATVQSMLTTQLTFCRMALPPARRGYSGRVKNLPR